MARVLAIQSVDLPHRLQQRDVIEAFADWLPSGSPDRERWIEAAGNGGVESRASLLSLPEARDPPSFTERNRRYGVAAIEWGFEALRGAMEQGAFRGSRFHTFVSVSCTGVSIPSADVFIATQLGLPASIRRIPITQLGCVGGAAALARAADAVDAHPHSTSCLGELREADLTALLSAEFSTLSFQRGDASPGNIVASAIFGDAVVGVVLGPEHAAGESGRPGPRIVASQSHIEPDTGEHLGFDLRSSGFHIVLSREVPVLVREVSRRIVPAFLARLDWSLEQVQHWILHPGSEKVLLALTEALGIPPGGARHSMGVLKDHGNPSSAGVLLALERANREALPGDRGIVLGFGPGFSAELLALEW